MSYLTWSSPKIPQGLCLLCSLLIIGQLGSLLKRGQTIQLQQKPAVALPIKKDWATHLLNTAFFGKYVPLHLTDAGVRESLLNVTVVGIMEAPRAVDSHALIRMKGGLEQTYHVGDALPGAGTIKRITREGILIDHKGSLESLSLPRDRLHFDPPADSILKEH